MVKEKNMDVTKYFSVNKDCELIVADWSYTNIVVKGSYPEQVEENKRTKPKDEYTITTRKDNYLRKINKFYSIPFDFLVQLLTVTKDSKFCTEVSDLALGSRLIYNIVEDEHDEQTTETQTYTVHKKVNKWIWYQVEAAEKVIEKVEEMPIYKANTGNEEKGDGENNKVARYTKKDYVVTIVTTLIQNSYTVDFLEVDSWIAKYNKEYEYKKDSHEVPDAEKEKKGKYKKIKNEGNDGDIEKDEHAVEIKKEKEKEYRDLVTIPTINVTTKTEKENNQSDPRKTKETTKKKIVTISDSDKIEETTLPGTRREYGENDTLPYAIGVRTKANGKLPEIDIPYSHIDGKYTSYYTKDNIIECIINKLKVETFERLDFKSITVTNYNIDYKAEEKEEKVKIYDTMDKKNGKFLPILANRKQAQRMLYSSEDWLYNMMAKNEHTADMVDNIKYLLFCFDSKYRGVSELDTSMFYPNKFNEFGSGLVGDTIEERIWWALKDAGFNDFAIAGVLGNIWVESEFKTDEVNPNGGASGLCQWMYVPGYDERLKMLKDYAKSKGVDWTDEATQIEFLIAELTPDGKGIATYQFFNKTYENQWKNATNVKDGTEGFYNGFERGGPSQWGGTTVWNDRVGAAQKYYNMFHNKKRPAGGGVNVVGKGKLCYPVPSCQTVSCGFYGYANHNGIDFSNANVYGADVVASADGVVTRVRYLTYSYGYHVYIYHKNLRNNYTILSYE